MSLQVRRGSGRVFVLPRGPERAVSRELFALARHLLLLLLLLSFFNCERNDFVERVDECCSSTDDFRFRGSRREGGVGFLFGGGGFVEDFVE